MREFAIILSSYIVGHYYLELNDVKTPRGIARELNIKEEEYREIISKYGISNTNLVPQYYFPTKEIAQNAIDELEPYLIMKILIE